MSNISPFVSGAITDAIDPPFGGNDIVDKIFDGSATHTTLGLLPHKSLMHYTPYRNASPQYQEYQLRAFMTSYH